MKLKITLRKAALFICLATIFSSCNKGNNEFILPTFTNQPNILLIIADDIGIEACPGYNIGAIKPNIPNLENLADNGLTFYNSWASPLCSPTRATILTGRYGYRTGVLNAEDASTIDISEKTIQTFLDENTNSAYSHAIIGKWHLSNNEPNRPNEMGVNYFAGLISGAVQNYNNWLFTGNGQNKPIDDYITTKITDLAIDWIGNQSNPWFCWVAYNAAHTPFHLPPSYMHSQGNLPTDKSSIESNHTPILWQ